jgi:hypothetical protein
MLAAIHLTRIDDSDRLVIEQSKPDDERRDPAGTVDPLNILPGNYTLSDFDMRIVYADRRAESQREKQRGGKEEENSGADRRSPSETQPAGDSGKHQCHGSKGDVMASWNITGHCFGNLLLLDYSPIITRASPQEFVSKFRYQTV